jgi:hypothetical protein
MANQPNENNRKVTYQEHKEVYATLVRMADEETKNQPYTVSVGQKIRTLTWRHVNQYLTKHGQKPIMYDPAAGAKFAPGNAALPHRAVVKTGGGMTVYDKCGNKIKGWSNVSQIPELLRLFPRCRIEYDRSDIDKYF